MNRRIDPLSPEERDLAERLTRLGGPREPAPALDAAILAAARAAVAGDEANAAVPPVAPATSPQADPPQAPASPNVTPFRPKRTVPRWPLGLSVAATVVLAAGIGWKLQGDGEGSSAEKAMAPASAPAAQEEAVLLDPSLDRAPVQPPPLPPPLQKDEDALQARRAAADTAARQVASKPSPPAENDGFVADAAVMPEAPAAAAPMPSPAPPAREQAVAVDRESKGVIDVSGNKVPRTAIGQASDRAVGAAEYTRTPLEQRREDSRSNRLAEPAAAQSALPPPPEQETMSARDRARKANRNAVGSTSGTSTTAADKSVSAERYDDRPPVSADSPEFRQAWLQRVRTLLTAGDTAAAAESLQEFRRRYPSVELPEDLRKFAATLPSPTP